jgi:glyoxylase I family protein
MALVDSSGFAHVRLTVTDIGRSKDFYDQVFGWPAAIDNTDKAGDPGVRESAEQFFGGVVYQTPSGALFGLRPGDGSFDPATTGLDHVSFLVDSRDSLVAAHDALDAAGVPHGEIIDLAPAGIAILSFQDPDDVNIELTAML